ncbi:MAG: hybrid sensor histidine kinase/response regulator [Gemmatimonadaceae bacterium]|nr:hybrid sensor histidine kinase/response regulator [Gemmatimonadaceae bacterium]
MTATTSGAPLILVADDSDANCELLREQLHSLGFRSIVAQDGPTVLATARAERPNLVILDVHMPAGDLEVDDGATGFEVCRLLKRDPRTASIPVIFITALNDTEDRVRAVEAGGDDFLAKPHNRLLLGARVRSLLTLKAATDALEESYRRLRELERVRDDLMKMIVHDLKTPLTSILATLELLGDGDMGPLGQRQRDAVADTQRKAEELLSLIDDLLEVRRIEETSIALNREQIDPASLLEELLRDWALRLRQEGTIAAADVAADTPSFSADRGMLRRVIGNLIQNALIHSGAPIELTLMARPDPNGVRFTVLDTGPGIPAEYHDIIFQKFEQVRAAHTPRVRTSGLGLTFCRLVIEAHGGRIWVQSTEGAGSAFHFILPVAPAEMGADAP